MEARYPLGKASFTKLINKEDAQYSRVCSNLFKYMAFFTHMIMFPFLSHYLFFINRKNSIPIQQILL
jgi:hypothetical protein